MSMTIEPQKIQEQAENTTEGIFSSSAWCDIFEASGKSLAVFSGDQKIAPFVLFHFKKFGKDVLIHPPLCGKLWLETSHKTRKTLHLKYRVKAHPQDHCRLLAK